MIRKKTDIAQLSHVMNGYIRPPATLIAAEEAVEELASELGVKHEIMRNLWDEVPYENLGYTHRLFNTNYRGFDNPIIITDGLLESWNGCYSEGTYGQRVMNNLRRLFKLGANGILWPDIVPISLPAGSYLAELQGRLSTFGIISNGLGESCEDCPIHLWVPRPV